MEDFILFGETHIGKDWTERVSVSRTLSVTMCMGLTQGPLGEVGGKDVGVKSKFI